MQDSQSQEPDDQDSRRRKGAVVAWGVAAALLAGVGTAWAIPKIQDDLERTTRARLEAAGIEADHLKIDGSGRIIRISQLKAGDDPDAIREAALDWGVRRVEIDEDGSGGSSDGRPQTEAKLAWTDAKSVTLSGTVHDLDAQERLVDAAHSAFGEAGVTDEIEVDGNITATSAIGPLADRLTRIQAAIPEGSVAIDGDRVTITGTPKDAAALTKISTELEAAGANVDLVDPATEDENGDGSEDAGAEGAAAVYAVDWNPAGARISGSVPTQGDADQLTAAYGGTKPLDGTALTVDDATGTAPTAPATGTAAISAALPALADLLPTGTLSVDGTTVTLTGELDPAKVQALSTVTTALQGSGLTVVDSTAPPAATPTAPPTTATPTTAAPPTTVAPTGGEEPLDAQAQAVEDQLATFVAANPIPFASGSADLLPEADGILNQIAGLLNQAPGTRVAVEGHTDSQGDDALNAQLSTARAEAVRGALIAKGVGADRLTAVGFGETQPVADNATVEGRAANRRVVFNLTKG